jgi:hypothetical protein
MAASSCWTTIWDPHWDPRRRMLIHALLHRQADFAISAAFERARCTTLDAAKCLTIHSPCLQVFQERERMQLLEAIDAADCEGQCFTISSHCIAD